MLSLYQASQCYCLYSDLDEFQVMAGQMIDQQQCSASCWRRLVTAHSPFNAMLSNHVLHVIKSSCYFAPMRLLPFDVKQGSALLSFANNAAIPDIAVHLYTAIS